MIDLKLRWPAKLVIKILKVFGFKAYHEPNMKPDQLEDAMEEVRKALTAAFVAEANQTKDIPLLIARLEELERQRQKALSK